MAEDLAGEVAGRAAWSVSGDVAVFVNANGWTARVRRIVDSAKGVARWHAAVLDTSGVARHTRPCHTPREAVDWAERCAGAQ